MLCGESLRGYDDVRCNGSAVYASISTLSSSVPLREEEAYGGGARER